MVEQWVNLGKLVEGRLDIGLTLRYTKLLRLHFARGGVGVLVKGRRGVILPAAATNLIEHRQKGGRW